MILKRDQNIDLEIRTDCEHCQQYRICTKWAGMILCTECKDQDKQERAANAAQPLLNPFTDLAPLEPTDRSALQAIADMSRLVGETTDYKQLLALAIAIAQVQLEGGLS